MDEDESWLLLHINFLRCSQAAFTDGLKFAQELIIINLVYRFLMQNNVFPIATRHTFSMVLGIILLYSNIGHAYLWPIALMLGAYSVMLVTSRIMSRNCGGITTVLVIGFLLCSELCVVNPKMWQQIRGIQMIVAMKIISVAIDVDSGLLKELPNAIAYTGYVICPASCIMGPWVPFRKYEETLSKISLNFKWVVSLVRYLLISMIMLILSTCFIPLYFSSDMNKWFTAFRDALSFRMSHYFVSAISQVSMTASGSGSIDDNYWWVVEVTNPLQIELPRSLVQVVIYWNMPMHKWLKTYVFKVCQARGQFFAIFSTYAVSSLLHGLNFQLSAVLLTIGSFSYIEYKIRQKLSKIFSCCCLASPCGKNCNHVYKSNNMCVKFVNFIFGAIAVIHLAYLGVMFEASFAVQETGFSYHHTLRKWKELDYASHIVAGLIYFIYVLICYFEY